MHLSAKAAIPRRYTDQDPAIEQRGSRSVLRDFLKSSIRWRAIAMAGIFCALGLSYTIQTLLPRFIGDRLQVSAPGLHFLTGKSLERLHDGASVPYAFQMTLSSIPRGFPLQRTFDRFVVSYDVWGETFAVVEAREASKSVSHLAASTAESWCIEQMGLSSIGVPLDRDLWLRLEVRAEEPLSSPLTESGLSLTSLIDLFSKPPRSQSQEWIAESAAFRLPNLKR